MSDTESKPMTEAQRAYEARRAAKAGMSLEKWLDAKRRQEAAEKQAAEKAAKKAAAPPKKPSLLSRLIDRAHKPI